MAYGELAGWMEVEEAIVLVTGDLDTAVPQPWQFLSDSK